MPYYSENKEWLQEYRRNLFNSNIENKKYYCDKCNKAYRDKTQLNRHLRSKKHNGILTRYKCTHAECSYESKAQYHLNKHLQSRKHR